MSEHNTPTLSDEQFNLLLHELREINAKLASLHFKMPIQFGCQHEYPNPWFSTSPPFCKKCGQQAPSLQPFYTTS